MVKLLRLSPQLSKETGIPMQAIICPMHPRITTGALHTIVMEQYKNYRYDKKQQKDVVDSMGLHCPRCSFIAPVDMKKSDVQMLQQIDEGKEAEKTASKLDSPPPLV